jgi:hypothetical protein
MQRSSKLVAAVLAALSCAGCAGSGAGLTSGISPPESAPSYSPAGGYVLSADEQELDCKKLTGRMQIRILEIRDYNERHQASAFSRALQSGVAAVTGGSKAGTDPDGDFTKDRAMLDAYNKQLAAKGCKAYDLNAELQPKDFHVTPNPTIKPTVAPAGVAPPKAN